MRWLPKHLNKKKAAWFSFLALVDSYANAPIYHFCPYEAQTVKRLGELYGNQGVDIRTAVRIVL